MSPCVNCGKPSVTKDGRPPLCLKCLRNTIKHETPIIGCYHLYRSPEKREDINETKKGRD